MSTDRHLLEMLTGYAAAHQHPFNVFVHMLGIPTIMLGVLIPLSWVGIDIESWRISLAHATVFGFFAFYLTLDLMFSLVFLTAGLGLAVLAAWIGTMPMATAGAIAAACFFGGYAAQFVGHAVEKSMPVLLRHPIQANLAAPFFTVVELFKILGLREELFDEVQRQIRSRRQAERTTAL